MALPKSTRTILLVAAVAAAAWFAYYLYKKHQTQQAESPTGTLGTNLNSVAPELIGGSTGPSVGPALSAPINITLNESVAANPSDTSSTNNDMLGANNKVPSALARQGQAAGMTSGQDVAEDINAGVDDQTGTTGAPGLGEGGGTPSNPGGINEATSGVEQTQPMKKKVTAKVLPPRRTVPPRKRREVKRAR